MLGQGRKAAFEKDDDQMLQGGLAMFQETSLRLFEESANTPTRVF